MENELKLKLNVYIEAVNTLDSWQGYRIYDKDLRETVRQTFYDVKKCALNCHPQLIKELSLMDINEVMLILKMGTPQV